VPQWKQSVVVEPKENMDCLCGVEMESDVQIMCFATLELFGFKLF